MIHIRLDNHTHRALKILAAKMDASVQLIVEDLIKHKLASDYGEPGKTD